MQIVEVFIGTSLRGPAKGSGKAMYIMKSVLNSGKEYEGKPQITQAEDMTESQLVLLAIRDAIQRINYACEVVIRTECSYIANAINNHWPEGWQESSWKNSRGEDIKGAEIWQDILILIDETGHLLRGESGKHEFSEWMRFNMGIKPAFLGYFTEVK